MCSWREERCRRRCLSRFVQAKGLQKAFNRSPLGLNLYPWLNYRIFPAWRPGIRQSRHFSASSLVYVPVMAFLPWGSPICGFNLALNPLPKSSTSEPPRVFRRLHYLRRWESSWEDQPDIHLRSGRVRCRLANWLRNGKIIAGCL